MGTGTACFAGPRIEPAVADVADVADVAAADVELGEEAGSIPLP